VPGPGNAVEALASSAAALSVWRLTAGAAGWALVQHIKVPIPYGSSS
jgi:hypothetical protein